jgi:transposase InsO family protein
VGSQPQTHRPVDAPERLAGASSAASPVADQGGRAGPEIPDLVGRQFNPELLDIVWCGDITYVRTGEGWLYLATVIDLASRRLIGWSMGDRHDATLVVDALRMAVAVRGRTKMDGTIVHHDRGSEYTSDALRTAAKISVSPSRPDGPARVSTTPLPSPSSQH